MIARLLWRPLVALFALLAAWVTGRRDARQKAALEAAEAYAKTRKAIDDADDVPLGDPGALRDWLRARDPDQR